MLNPIFLLAHEHRNRYLEGIDDGQKTPRGHPYLNSYVKILLVFITDRQTDTQTDRGRNTLAARGLEELRVKYWVTAVILFLFL